MEAFPSTPENYHGRRIVRPVLDSTGLKEGDDHGYRKVSVDESKEPLVELTEEHGLLRPSYDGYDEVTGERDESLALPGGVNGKMYARESVAKAFGELSRYLADRYGPNVKPMILDAFRSCLRQAAGFTRLGAQILNGNENPDTRTFFKAFLKADGTFAYVHPERTSPIWEEFKGDLRGSTDLFKDLQDIGEEIGMDAEDVLEEFATFCANIKEAKDGGLEQAQNLQIPLNMAVPLRFENNAHAGGGAVDTFLAVDGKPASSLVPFDHAGEEAAIEYMENMKSFPRFVEAAQKSPQIRAFLERMGMSPETLTEEQWKFARDANRILHHALKRIGATYYSAANMKDGGENWHKEPGNIVRAADTGRVIHRGGFADRYPDSGNPGHALQRMPRGQAMAVWGGTFAHKQLGLI